MFTKALDTPWEISAEVRVVAFGPLRDVAGMAKAKELSCNQVVSKGEFSRDLHKILENS